MNPGSQDISVTTTWKNNHQKLSSPNEMSGNAHKTTLVHSEPHNVVDKYMENSSRHKMK